MTNDQARLDEAADNDEPWDEAYARMLRETQPPIPVRGRGTVPE